MIVVEIKRSVLAPFHGRRGKERHELFRHTNGPRTRPTPAVRRGKGLVEIRVDDVDAHVARPRDADERVEIRAVAIQVRTFAVEDLRHRADLALENAERIRHRDHQRGDVFVHRVLERLQIDRASRVRLQLADLVAGECRRRGIRSVRGVGYEDVLARIATLREGFVNHEDAGELAVCAGDRLQRDPRHSEDRFERLFEIPEQLEIALHLMIGLQRMRKSKARRPRELLVQPRIVFHGARSERIQAGVDRDIQLRQAREVPDDVDFGDFDFIGDLIARQILRKQIGFLRNVERRQTITATSALRMLEDQSLAVRALGNGCGRGFLFDDCGHRRSREIAALSTAAYRSSCSRE